MFSKKVCIEVGQSIEAPLMNLLQERSYAAGILIGPDDDKVFITGGSMLMTQT